MTKSKALVRRTGLLLSATLLLTSGCGSQGASQGPEPVQDIEILYHADDGEADLSFIPSEVDVSEQKRTAEDEGKIVITLALASDATGDAMDTIAMMAVTFNHENEKYYIELRTCHYGEELATMKDRLLVEVGAGGGPDIMTETVFPVTQEIMDSGILVDLTPYLEKSGITSEAFFPAYATLVSGDRIYGIQPSIAVTGYSVDAEVLGDREPPEDVEALADLLLEYPGHGSFLTTRFRGRYILRYFLEGSEDLWGMIDWEEKTCDFTGPLFSKFLDVAKRYREDGIKGYEPVVHLYLLYMTCPPSYSIPKFCPGSVPIGLFFDDGPHYENSITSETVMINANTEHLEGAYAFLSYLLSKGGQEELVEPVNKELWDARYQYYLDLLEKIPDHPEIPPLNEETRQEILEAYEDARYVPKRAEAILEIVYEEAEGYIEGDRNKEDVINVIQNRVQLYLDEH
ncbi:MAG: carbohydrate ABC transporter substrate-binding protein [Acetatifactor sp.]|nr:carbohydrate ABC transporter substrate-binding protein [Acetatifactor sp.]